MEILVIIGLLAILSEVSILVFMLMKEWFLPFVGQCVCDFMERLGQYMKNKGLLDLFRTVLIGIVCPFALLIDKNQIISRENAGGGEEVGK